MLATTYKWFGKLIGWVLAGHPLAGARDLWSGAAGDPRRQLPRSSSPPPERSAVAGVLIALEVIDTNATLWSIIGLSGLAFVAWTLVMALAHGRRQSEQPDADPGGGV